MSVNYLEKWVPLNTCVLVCLITQTFGADNLQHLGNINKKVWDLRQTMTQGFSGTHFSRLLTDMSSYNNDKGSSWPHVWDCLGQSILKPKLAIFAKMRNSVFSLEDSMYKPGNVCHKGVRWHNSSLTIVLWNCKTWALNVLLSRRWSSFKKKVTLWPFSVELPFGAFSRVVWSVVSLKSREIFSNGLFSWIVGELNHSKNKIKSPGGRFLWLLVLVF